MAEDEDIEQNSEEYRKWRQGKDNEKYASSTTPTETGAKSGEYQIPTSSYEMSTSSDTVEDGGDGKFWIALVVAVIIIISSGIISIYLFMQSSEDVAGWPTTEGSISETYYTDGWVEECDDDNDDGYEDDGECHDVFWCKIEVSYNFTVEGKKYFNTELGIDGDYGESQCQNQLEDKYVVNNTVIVHYNSDDPNENYIKNPPTSGLAILCCILPIIIIIITIAVFAQVTQNYSNPSGGRLSRFRGRRFGRFGMFGRGPRGRSSSRSSKRRTTRTKSRRR